MRFFITSLFTCGLFIFQLSAVQSSWGMPQKRIRITQKNIDRITTISDLNAFNLNGACFQKKATAMLGVIRGHYFIRPVKSQLSKNISYLSNKNKILKVEIAQTIKAAAHKCKAAAKVAARKCKRACPTPTPSLTPTPSPSPSPTVTPSPSMSPSPSPSASPSASPSVSPSPSPSLVPIPELAQWEAQMTSYGSLHCQNLNNPNINFDTHLAATYYDAEWVFYQIGDYTGDNTWYNCAQAAESVYRDNYVAPNNGTVPGYWGFSHGVTKDYLTTQDTESHDTVVLLSQNQAYAPDWTPLSWTQNANMSREVAYAIMSYLNAEKVGEAHRPRCEQLVDQSLNHLDQWFVSQTADYVRPFMFALTAQALISYDAQIGGNAQILPALENGANWIWDHTWQPASQAFMYTDHNVPSGDTSPAPDLNLLIAPVYAWLWHQTGNPIYRDRADQIFAGGIVGAWLVNGKQFNQNYRWSFDYIKWRSLPTLH